MIIVHYIPDMSLITGIVPEYVNRLASATEQVSTNHILTFKDLGDGVLSFRKNLTRQLHLVNPDIVHVHASWDFYSALVVMIARKLGFLVVVSPHGGLSPENMEVNFWKNRLPRLLAYQIRMIKRCHMVVVTSEEELKDLKRLNWKNNIAIIPHPITNNISNEELRTITQAAYRKVIDTNYLRALSQQERQFVYTCVKAAVWNDERIPEMPVGEIDKEGLSFRRIYLYAHDQGVTDELIDGAHKLNVNLPPQIDVAAIPRFATKQPDDRKDARKLQMVIQILENLTGKTCGTDVRHITLGALLKAYDLLRFNDFDEDEFMRLAKKYDVLKYAKRLMSTFQTMFQLETGFMPVLPK